MFRIVLPVALALLAPPAMAQEPPPIVVPQIGIVPQPGMPDCTNIPYSTENCVRILACIGEDGLWLDGQAHGWDRGIVIGRMSDGTTCTGEWESGLAFGAGMSKVTCSDDSTARVIYHTQDNETGTVQGTGLDTKGRSIRVWTGLHVLDFLDRGDGLGPRLPCGDEPVPVPIS